MKIIYANCGYATGLTGKYSEYFLLFWRYIRVSRRSLTPIIDCVLYEKPDVVAFVEIKQHQYQQLRNTLYGEYPHSFELDKYGRGLLWQKESQIPAKFRLIPRQPI